MLEHKFKKIEDIDKWTKNLYKDWSEKYIDFFSRADKVDENFYDPLALYGGYIYRQVNEQLRGESDHHKDILIKLLKLIIVSAPEIPEDIIVYRWVRPEILDEIIEKSEDSAYLEQGFLSTTLDPSIKEHSDVIRPNFKLLKINVLASNRAAYVDLIHRRNEKELIFMNDCYLKYTGNVDTNEDFGYEQYEVNLIKFH